MLDVKAFGKTEGLFSNYLNFQVIADRVKDYQKLGHDPCSLLTIASLHDALDAETAECGLIVPELV